jgi:hypothetical protein
MNMQMTNGQSICKNGTVAHIVQQPDQETSPLSAVSSKNPGSWTITPVVVFLIWPGLDG